MIFPLFLRTPISASTNAYLDKRNGAGRRSSSQADQLNGRERQDAEHQVAHDLGRTLNMNMKGTELILEPAIGTFSDGALVVTDGIRRFEWFLFAAARVVFDERHVFQAAAMFVQILAAVGSVHQIVKIGNAFSADQRNGDGCTAVVHCRPEQRGRHAAVSRIHVQLVAVPTHLVALGIALRTVIAGGGDFLEHFCQRLLTLAGKGRFLGCRTCFSAPWPTAFSCQRPFYRTNALRVLENLNG